MHMPLSPPKIIGLLGRARSGKDTVADYLLSAYPEKFYKLRLAAPIKTAVCALYGFTPEQVEGPEKELVDPYVGVSPREAMVHLTKSVMDFRGHDVFIRRLLHGSLLHADPATDPATDPADPLARRPIIPDVRYEHDVAFIKQQQGVVLRIQRPGASAHSWEAGIDDIAAIPTIVNDGTLEDLRARVAAWLVTNRIV